MVESPAKITATIIGFMFAIRVIAEKNTRQSAPRIGCERGEKLNGGGLLVALAGPPGAIVHST
jgi:hypothetical protein